MPSKTNHKRIARRTGARTHRGNSSARSRREGSEPKKSSSSIIANSAFALTLKPVHGTHVECGQSVVAGMPTLLKDLLGCYRILSRDKIAMPPGNTASDQIAYVLKHIKKVIPAPLQFNIDCEKKTGRHFITIYHLCEYVNWLPAFKVGQTILKLKKHKPKVHDLFISFLKAFRSVTHVDTWYSGIFERSVEAFEEHITYEDHGALEEEFLEIAHADLELYQKGDAAKYRRIIESKRVISTKKLRALARKIRGTCPIKNIILQGCDIIDFGRSMFDFCYNPDRSGEDDYRWNHEPELEFDCQAVIFWETDGPICDEYDSWVEMEANEGGVQIPCYHVKVKPTDKAAPDFEMFKQNCSWPKKLAQFFSFTLDQLTKFHST